MHAQHEFRSFARTLLTTSLILAAIVGGVSSTAVAAPSTIVFVGADGKLVYKADARGNRVMDFSTAGYRAGGVALPVVPAVVTVNPTGGDDTTAIQAAIDAVSVLPVDGNGARGAVLLAPGTFNITATVRIATSGVVLRGSGSTGASRTTINMQGAVGYLAVSVAGTPGYTLGPVANFVNQYVPSGTSSVTVTDASGFVVGDPVLVQRTVTDAWIHLVGMDTLVRDGLPQTWLAAGTKINTDRTIAAINGNTLVLDAPLSDSFDPAYLGDPPGTIAKYDFPGRITEVGVEHLRVLSPADTVNVYGAVSFRAVMDGWISDVVGQETQNAFNISADSKRITFDHVINNTTVPQTRTAATGDFSPTGSQVLLNACQSNGSGDWAVVTGSVGTGPIVILNFSGSQTSGISPHQRWTTGILTDSASLTKVTSSKQGIAYRNRGTDGTGQGWTTGWSVGWNTITPYLLVSQAPGSTNWCIGCVGTRVSSSDPIGFYEGTAVVSPDSLYLWQLHDRLGDQALAAIGAQPFNLSAAPATRSVVAGSSTTFTATHAPRIYNLTGSGASGAPGKLYNGATTFSVTGLPAGASAGFAPASLTTTGSSTLTVTTTKATVPGDYPLTIRAATAAGASYATTSAVVLSVTPPPPDFALGATPASQSVIRGGGTSYTVTSSALGGFSGTVTLKVSGLPTGATGTFAPASIAGAGSATLTIATTTATATGSKTLTITGTSGTLVHTATVTLVINAPPAPVSYEAEATANTFSGAVASGTCSGCSGGKRVRFIGGNSSNFLVINNVAAASAGNRTLTIYPVVSGTRSFSISVNGGSATTFSATGTNWTGPSAALTTTVALQAGNNTIKIFNDTANAPDFDRITIQ